MPTPTYTALANITLGTAASSVTFGSIPATYRDLICVVSVKQTSASSYTLFRVNGDTGSNYTEVQMYGDGSTTFSDDYSRGFIGLLTQFFESTTNSTQGNITFMDYSATDKHKSILFRSDLPSSATNAVAARWANTAAITSINFSVFTGNFAVGSTFNLYGISA